MPAPSTPKWKHSPTAAYPTPSGWRVPCSCGHKSRGITRDHAYEVHDRHVKEESA